MKNQRYKLLTTIIVSALHPNEPHAPGTVWEPTNAIDVQEADQLVEAKYAEKTSDAKATVTPTWLQRQDDAKRKAVEAPAEEPVPGSKSSTQDDGLSDEELELVLEGNVEQVKAELDGLTREQLLRLDELEGDKDQGGKQRKGVHDAIADAIAALEDGEQE